MTIEEAAKLWPRYIHSTGSCVWAGDGTESGWCIGTGSLDRKSYGRRTHPDFHNRASLEKYDGLRKFSKDEDAWTYVWQKAAEGNAQCRAALLYLRIKAPDEYAQIRRWNLEGV